MQINLYNEHIRISERARIFIGFVAIFWIFVLNLIFAISVGRGPCAWPLFFFFTPTPGDNICLSDSWFAALATLAFSKFHSSFLCFTPVLWRGTLLIEFALRVCVLTLILRRSRTGTVWFYTPTSNKRAARPKLYTESLTRDLKRMYSRLTLVRISINL